MRGDAEQRSDSHKPLVNSTREQLESRPKMREKIATFASRIRGKLEAMLRFASSGDARRVDVSHEQVMNLKSQLSEKEQREIQPEIKKAEDKAEKLLRDHREQNRSQEE